MRRLGNEVGNGLNRKIKYLAARYNDIVLTGAKTCSEMPGAGKLLRSLNLRYRLYVSSTTPEDPLKEIVQFRGWTGLFVDVFGYPRRKSETILHIFKRENAVGSEVLVVGDGESDRQSALENGCYFVHVTDDFRLKDLENIIKSTVID